METVRQQLAAALKEARLAGGFQSQGALAKRLLCSRSTVNKAESGSQPVPHDAILTAWASETGADPARFLDLAQRAKSAIPAWFVDYLPAEQAATSLRLWGPAHPPGLLQTETYADALLSGMRHTAEHRAELVRLRMGRQKVLDQAAVTAVIDYRALTNPIGTPACMSEQCAHLAALAESGKIGLHVVPEGLNVALGGAHAIASHGGSVTVNLSTTVMDVCTTDLAVVERTLRMFDVALGASLSAVPSIEFVRHKEAEWKQAV